MAARLLSAVIISANVLLVAAFGSAAPAVPTDREGNPFPQQLADSAAAGSDIRLFGDWYEQIDVQPGERELPKGPLDPRATALVIVDMQPLFYDATSCWGAGGLENSVMNELWPRHLELHAAVSAFTGRANSTLLTQYIPADANEAFGQMRHYFKPENQGCVTPSGLREAGADPDFLYGVMPELQPLVAAGALVQDKGNFGGGPWPATRSAMLNPLTSLDLDAVFGGPYLADEVRTLIVVGVETDYCVLSAVMHGMDLGYRVVVVKDAVGSSQPNSHQATLDYTFRRFDNTIDMATTEQLIQILGLAAASG